MGHKTPTRTFRVTAGQSEKPTQVITPYYARLVCQNELTSSSKSNMRSKTSAARVDLAMGLMLMLVLMPMPMPMLTLL